MSECPHTITASCASQVFAEKPLCCEATEAKPLFEEAEKNRVLLFTALNRRHDPQIVAAKAKLESGEMGQPLSARLPSELSSRPRFR